MQEKRVAGGRRERPARFSQARLVVGCVSCGIVGGLDRAEQPPGGTSTYRAGGRGQVPDPTKS